MSCDRISSPQGQDAQDFTVADPLHGPWVRRGPIAVHVARTTVLAYGPQLLRTDPPPVLAQAPRSA